jgi:hypothetical protein
MLLDCGGLTLVVRCSISSSWSIDFAGGFPAVIRVDKSTEFVSRDLDLWAYQRGVTLDFSRPSKPTTMPSSSRSMASFAPNA